MPTCIVHAICTYYFKIPVHTTFRNRRIQLHEIQDPEASKSPTGCSDAKDVPLGTLAFDDEHFTLFIRCGDGWLACTKVQVEGKRALDIRNFLNGYQLGNVKNERFR